MMEDDRDAWLEDVRRWFYGGTPPAEPAPERDAEPAPVGEPAALPRAGFDPRTTCLHQED
ncbi:MAG: hypothetical protein MZW92_26365 [Comamonadaceae bacterium]|nr:hypothetical protein [Comamonadaceae bacterium]